MLYLPYFSPLKLGNGSRYRLGAMASKGSQGRRRHAQMLPATGALFQPRAQKCPEKSWVAGISHEWHI